MGAKTGIEWADVTWNPWQGCTPVSEGCERCYMAREKRRYGQDPWTVVRSKPRTFNMPRSRTRVPSGSLVFVCSWSDFFHPAVPAEWVEEALEIMGERTDVTFLLLTKRVEQMAVWVKAIEDDTSENSSHIWLGVTAENQERWNERVPALCLIDWPGPRWVSVEPMLGPIVMTDLGTRTYPVCGNCGDGSTNWGDTPTCCDEPALYDHDIWGVDWVICGAESGPDARPMNPDWARQLRDQCQGEVVPVPFCLKQMEVGGQLVKAPELDGRQWLERPVADAKG